MGELICEYNDRNLGYSWELYWFRKETVVGSLLGP